MGIVSLDLFGVFSLRPSSVTKKPYTPHAVPQAEVSSSETARISDTQWRQAHLRLAGQCFSALTRTVSAMVVSERRPPTTFFCVRSVSRVG